ncbi:MAG: hypothetical protein VB859_04635 [Planctomycetaceae bacterium]
MRNSTRSALILMAVVVFTGSITATSEAANPFSRFFRSRNQSTARRSPVNLRRAHAAGKQNFRRNWSRIKGSADAAGFALGGTTAKLGYQAGFAAGGPFGPATGAAGAVIGYKSPEAVVGVARSGYYYGKGVGREVLRQTFPRVQYRSRRIPRVRR